MNAPLRSALGKLGDGKSASHAIVSTVAMSALALVNPRTLTPGRRMLYRSALAGLTGWMAWASMREESSAVPVPPEVKVGVTAASAGVVMGAAEFGEHLDGKIHDGLVKRGVKRPRVWIAAATAVLNLAVFALDRTSNDRFALEDRDDLGEYDEFEDAQTELVELPDEVRALIETLLGATEGYGSTELRQQLTTAQMEQWFGEDESRFYPGVGVHTEAGLPLAVPGNGNFPVIGRYRALGGKTFDVYITLQEGKLSSLSISEAADWSEEDMIDWYETGRSVQDLDGWPHPDELELLIETPEGYRLVDPLA